MSSCIRIEPLASRRRGASERAFPRRAWERGSPAFEQLGQVHDTGGQVLAVERSADVHEASRVGADEKIGTRVLHAGDLVANHGSRDLGITHGKRAAESAALVLALERNIFDSVNCADQLLGLI